MEFNKSKIKIYMIRLLFFYCIKNKIYTCYCIKNEIYLLEMGHLFFICT